MTDLPQLVEADIIQCARDYTGERFHAILCDPPYALISIAKRFGKPGSAPAQEGTDGSFARLSKGFMGQAWDSFESLDQYREWVETWALWLIDKMLHPGAVCLFFGGTRTWHHLALGLEAGGFEVYDTLLWLYGSGFPKSHDIGKGIDKAAGAEGEIIEEYEGTFGINKTRFEQGYRPNLVKPGAKRKPATPEAEQWEGYGTGLKPAWEPIILCRAPRKGATFASLALEHGSGALNIDGGRIGYESGGSLASNPSKREKIAGGMGGHVISTEDERRHMIPHLSGRWPANLVMSHHDDCKLVGSTKVPARVLNRWEEGAKPFGGAGGLGLEYQSEQTGDNEGMETIERWACVPECPIRQLDDQAGIRVSGKNSIKKETSSGHLGTVFGAESREAGTRMIEYADSGGPSRFFYCGKASRAEKDKGLENWFWQRTDDGFERVSEAEWRCLPRRERARGNIHPTVKPLELLRYLARLIEPPNEVKPRLLVPFSGSGSEVIAAHQVGWSEVVGIEISTLYNEMAEARMLGTLGMF